MKTHPLGESIGLEDRPHTPWRVAAIVALVLGTLALGAVGGAQVLHAAASRPQPRPAPAAMVPAATAPAA